MRLIRRLVELAFVLFVISLFMKNKDIEIQFDYYGMKEPIKVAFWQLVTICVSIGIIIAAVGDFVTQVKWLGERRKMIKRDQEHQGEVDRLNTKIRQTLDENQRLKKETEAKSKELDALRPKGPVSVLSEPSAAPEARESKASV